jgi:hypothetical protein
MGTRARLIGPGLWKRGERRLATKVPTVIISDDLDRL